MEKGSKIIAIIVTIVAAVALAILTAFLMVK